MLFFLYDHMMVDYKLYQLPLTFVAYAYIDGYKLYKHKKRFMAIEEGFIVGKRGNNRVYGGIFQMEDAFYYARILDAEHGCSLTRLLENHPYDFMHRCVIRVHPISFDTLSSFSSYRFDVLDPIKCQVYLGNKLDSKFKVCIHTTRNKVVSGIDTKSFMALYKNNKTLDEGVNET